MISYDEFVSRLFTLCERGKLDRALKNRFCRFKGRERGEIAYGVCAELCDVFGTVKRNSEQFFALCDATGELIVGLYDDAPHLSRDVAVVCAYIRLTKDANQSADPAPIFKKLTAHRADYERSLQSLKHGIPLF